MEDKNKFSIGLSLCLILLGVSQWIDPSDSSARWRWFQVLGLQLFGQNGHAKLLIGIGAAWLLWCLIIIFLKRSKGDGK